MLESNAMVNVLLYSVGRQRSAERVFSNDGLIPVRSRRDDRDGHADDGLQAFEIAAGIGGQIFIPRDADRAVLPPRHVFVYGLAAAEVLGKQRRRGSNAAV